MIKYIKEFIIVLIILMIAISPISNANNVIVKKYTSTTKSANELLESFNNETNNDYGIKNVDKKISAENYINKEKVETDILDKKDNEYIRRAFGETREFNDGQYKGSLSITDINIETIKNGYYEKLDEKILPFNNYTDNDLNNVKKEIEINGKTYYLINVEWEADKIQNIDGADIPVTYKGNKIYQTVLQIAYPDTYKVTVTYSGEVEKIDTIYDYTITYENKKIEESTKKEYNQKPMLIVSTLGIIILLVYLFNNKNTFLYSKGAKGFKLIKSEKLSDKNISIDLTNCKNKSKDNIYAIKINKIAFRKLKGRTISIVQGSKRIDLALWNNYYEFIL